MNPDRYPANPNPKDQKYSFSELLKDNISIILAITSIVLAIVSSVLAIISIVL